MSRKDFCLQQRKNWNPEILSDIPHFVGYGEGCHFEKNVIFANHGLGAEKINGKWLLIPHFGIITIGNDVTILDGAVIMRATKEVTKIGSGSIIGVRAHIGHNVQIGEGCLIGSGSLIGGSSVIGDGAYIGAGAKVSNKIKIGEGAIIGIGAVVIRDVPEGTWAGNPAKKIK